MSVITVTDFSELDAQAVQDNLDLLTQMLLESQPQASPKFGVIHNHLLLPSAQYVTMNRLEIDRLQRSSTIPGIAADPTLADPAVVDNIFRTRGIVRFSGTKAEGSITIVVSRLVTVTIPSGARFTQGTLAFVTENPYTARTSSANVQGSTDRVLTPVGDGTFSFTIPLVAEEAGAASMLKKGVLLESVSPITNLVKIVATSDFVGGIDSETNAQLIAREQEGIAARTVGGNRVNMSSFLRASEDFAAFVSSSIVGFGDAEMLRDKHSLFPFSFGGRCDWYVRTQSLPVSVTLTKTASLVQKLSDDRGIWQITFTRDEVPAFYDVATITPNENVNFAGTFPITEDERGINAAGITDLLAPDLVDVPEGVFTRYQIATIRFKDTETSVATLTINTSTKDYSVTVRHMPDIDAIQQLVGSRKYRCIFGDVLVKAPVPIFLSVAVSLQGQPGAALPDAEAIRQAVASKVNSLGFSGRLYASQLADVVYGLLPDRVNCEFVELLGKLLRPNGTTELYSSREALLVPDEPQNMVTARTCVFILDPRNVRVTAETVSAAESV